VVFRNCMGSGAIVSIRAVRAIAMADSPQKRATAAKRLKFTNR